MMKILLVAVNAKYIHTCPAVYSLKAYTDAKGIPGVWTDVAEYTINDRYRDVLDGIMLSEADVIAFSTYIWNVDRVRRLIRDLRAIRGDSVMLWAGGPEVTYGPEPFLGEGGADLCMTGEGEETFAALASFFAAGGHGRTDVPGGLSGIAYLDCATGDLIRTGMGKMIPLDEIPFPYEETERFKDRLLYYEASRGCPFSCAYCLSGPERGTRYRSLEAVEEHLQFFLDRQVRQVKLTDRTFNADPVFACGVWRYIQKHDNGITNFHFEIEADRFTQEEADLATQLRPGLIQMEIGVQSANPKTLRSVHRNPDLSKVRDLMDLLTKAQNINLHLDLIAGLPYEGPDSFRHSFNTVYLMRPHQLQIGFLKLLRGTELYERREEYGLCCSEHAPYEVLRTRWMTFEDLALLHRISDRVEEYVNSQGFRRSLPLAEALFEDPFAMFEELAAYYRREGLESSRPSAKDRYDIFSAFLREAAGKSGRGAGTGRTAKAGRAAGTGSDGAENLEKILEMVRFDRALHVHPSRRMAGEEAFDFGDGPVTVRFDHRQCSPVNGEASYTIVFNR